MLLFESAPMCLPQEFEFPFVFLSHISDLCKLKFIVKNIIMIQELYMLTF